jgi:hypothetical protein
MHVPFSKVYRAFTEFDGFGDAECERYLRRAVINAPRRIVRLPLTVTLLVFVLWPVFVVTLEFVAPEVNRVLLVPLALPGFAGYLVLTTACISVVTWFFARDHAIWLALRDEVRRARCRRCGYSLEGLPVVQRPGLDSGRVGEQAVVCAECGTMANLLENGLTMRDLIPFEQRVIGESTGVPIRRRRPDWADQPDLR